MNRKTARSAVAAVMLPVILAVTSIACTPELQELEPVPNAGVLANALAKDYKRNPVRFNRQTRGATVYARGKISRIDPDGTVYFKPAFSNAHVKLQCRFKDPDEVTELNPGKRITVRGIVAGYRRDLRSFRYAELSRCALHGENEPL